MLQNNSETEKRASSKTLEKTIGELDDLLNRKRISTTSCLRGALHKKLFELLERETVYWYRKGFRRGHETSRRCGKKVPREISRKMRLKAVYFPPAGVRVVLKSTEKKRNE